MAENDEKIAFWAKLIGVQVTFWTVVSLVGIVYFLVNLERLHMSEQAQICQYLHDKFPNSPPSPGC